jgi:hypothetical protein
MSFPFCPDSADLAAAGLVYSPGSVLLSPVSDPESIWSIDWDDGLSQLTAYTAIAEKASKSKDDRITILIFMIF